MVIGRRQTAYTPAKRKADGQYSSIYRGVTRHQATQKWRANIKIKGKKIALGAYDDEVDAAKAFDRAALRYRGARAEVNFPGKVKKVQRHTSLSSKASSEETTSTSEDEMEASTTAFQDGPVVCLPYQGKKRKVASRAKRLGSSTPLPEQTDVLGLYNQDYMTVLDDTLLPDVPSSFVLDTAVSSTRAMDSPLPSASGTANDTPKAASPMSNEASNAADDAQFFTRLGSSNVSEQDALEMSAPYQVAWNGSDGSGDTGSPSNEMHRQDSVQSHGLCMLESRGFSLARYLHDEPRQGSTLPCPGLPSRSHSLSRASSARLPGVMGGGLQKRSYMDYRQMLLQRSMLVPVQTDPEDQEYSMEPQWACIPGLQAVNFGNSPMPAPSKNAWWRQQLQRAQAEDMQEQYYRPDPNYHHRRSGMLQYMQPY